MSLFKATSHNARAGRALFLPSWFSYFPLYHLYICSAIFIASVLFVIHPVAANEAINLRSDTQIATAGYYQLSWDWPAATPDTYFVLDETSKKDGEAMPHEIIYSGPNLASVISGKPDGVYVYTIRAMDAQQNILARSEEIEVTVEHHSLARAVVFFVIGLIVFVAILLVIMRGALRHSQEQST